jgi:hypothetical protein
MIPLSERVCIQAVTSHVPGNDGNFPTCLGECCSHYEICSAGIVDAITHIRDLKRRNKEPRRKKKWGEERK